MSETGPSPSALAPEVSPLAEADPNSLNTLIQERIDEIFNKKPTLLTDNDLRVIVEYYQKERLRFKAESQVKESKSKAPAAAARRKAPTSVAEAMSTSMDLL
jgi:hypothetical protein